MAAQNLHADGMEGAEPRHALDHLADDLADAVLHLARRLVGEGDGEDFAGPGAAEAEDVGDAHGEHAGLAGAGAGQHQHRAVERLHRLALLRIEPGEIGRATARRGAGARGDAARRRAAGGSVGSTMRFNGSATGLGATDSHCRKMAPARGFYEACPRHSGARPQAGSPESIITMREGRAHTEELWLSIPDLPLLRQSGMTAPRNDATAWRHFIYLSTTTLASSRSCLRKVANAPVEPAAGSR